MHFLPALLCTVLSQKAFADRLDIEAITDTGEEEVEVFDPIPWWPEKITLDASASAMLLVWFETEGPRSKKISFSEIKALKSLPRFEEMLGRRGRRRTRTCKLVRREAPNVAVGGGRYNHSRCSSIRRSILRGCDGCRTGAIGLVGLTTTRQLFALPSCKNATSLTMF